MDQEKIGKFIKNLRKKYNLTQNDLAQKYGVTFQAVSKWENGKNIPDIALLKKMSEDFNIDISDILDGEVKKKEKKISQRLFITVCAISIIFLIVLGILNFKKDDTFVFRSISSNCEYFEITGSIAYNKSMSSIYIYSIDYCGIKDDNVYNQLDCSLYEKTESEEILIDNYTYTGKEAIKLEQFLKEVKFTVNNYEQSCKEYKDNSLYIMIYGVDKEGKEHSRKIVLSLTDECN